MMRQHGPTQCISISMGMTRRPSGTPTDKRIWLGLMPTKYSE